MGVSIPFIAGQWSLPTISPPSPPADCRVSIPFIAGQWSLRECVEVPPMLWHVSIPFIAGQWSLPLAARRGGKEEKAFQSPSLRGSGRFRSDADRLRSELAAFQSPSLRGSGRFRSRRPSTRRPSSGFNPLHCGAVVASHDPDLQGVRLSLVSIPFIAGQWSLHHLCGGGGRGASRFNPLHCGAVVASQEESGREEVGANVSIPFIAGQWSLPRSCAGGWKQPLIVSIPFIAGQWSLLMDNDMEEKIREEFQSPSLRGSGRFKSHPETRSGRLWFQSPSLRGSGRFGGPRLHIVQDQQVSIPFIAGQWSLRS